MFLKVALVLAALALVVGIAARPSGGAGRPSVYVVKPADTLWSIATAHYAGDPREGVWQLERRNHLHDAVVVPGQRLVLPQTHDDLRAAARVSPDERATFNRKMPNFFTGEEYTSCERCGVSVPSEHQATHVCDPQQRAQFQAFQVRSEVAELEREVAAFFDSPNGRFEAYYAERERLRRAA